MPLINLPPRKALNKAYLKVKPNRSEIELFKSNTAKLLDQINENESEEFHKNLIIAFLKNTYYRPNHFINTKGRTDLVIHNGRDAKSSVGVIIETKKPTNKTEMLTTELINTKALHELILYYLRERITGKNLEIKHIIATNIYEWFVFDAGVFERHFAQNKQLVKQFNDFEAGRLSGTTTDYFYREIAKPFVDSIEAGLEYTYFDFRDYESSVRDEGKESDTKLIALHKLLSPEHMLKLPFINDSNTLNKSFYTELLHIIGLTEVKRGNNKLIERKKENERHTGSLIENTITQLDSLDKLSRIDDPSKYGAATDERLFTIALQLAITWINRILFLKLLEAQLIDYNRGDTSFAFLNTGKVKTFDDLNSLFFSVLAKQIAERHQYVKQEFVNVPYLNSSLFEPSAIEQKTIFISNLHDERTIPIHSSTVLKDDLGNKRKGELNTLEYLFTFLGAYDFSSEGSEEIQEENKNLINASVLGLIFEKINGYRDGSYFTPGFITMYMSKAAIRRAVVKKFNEAKGWKCEEFDDIYDKIDDKKEANDIINSLKICDPAVGSGHFLVSALNEIISVKSELKILLDRKGRTLRDYHVEVVNDELIVTDSDGQLFSYNPRNRERQRIQETLFHEKQIIIENCLFGVDINPNSVNICRLRLWIELLKNAYYKPESNYTDLETLPNIDINIKCGNSLVSRFPLDADLRDALTKSKWSIDSYRLAVQTYRSTHEKEVKREMMKLIDNIKSDFRTEISSNDPKVKRLNTRSGELFRLLNQEKLFAESKSEQKARIKKQEQLEKEITRLKKEIEEIRNNKVYENAFEWRFEFPEVLNDEGDFIGFDVVIGNPPYIRAEELGEFKSYLRNNYTVYSPAGDIFSYFYELSNLILSDKGVFCFINNTFDKTTAGKSLREFVLNNFKIEQYIDFTSVVVFEEATTYPIIILASKTNDVIGQLEYFKVDEEIYGEKTRIFSKERFKTISQNSMKIDTWNFNFNVKEGVFYKFEQNNRIREIYGKCYYGIKTGLNKAFIVDKYISESEVLKAVYNGKDIKKWLTPEATKWMIVFKNGSTKEEHGTLPEAEALKEMSGKYPEIFDHLLNFEKQAKKRYDKGEYWWELRNCAYYDLFEKPKIIFPNLQNSNKFSFDDSGAYINAPAVFLPTDDIYLLAILNSNLIWHFLTSICVVRRGGYIEVKPQYFEQIPLPDISNEIKQLLTEKVEKMFCAKKNDDQSNINQLEKEIDNIVYQIYNLTDEEIALIEGEN